MKRRRAFELEDDGLRLLALQPHQISGTVDPRTPIRALLAPRATPKPVRCLKDPEIGRLVNERLAPGGIN